MTSAVVNGTGARATFHPKCNAYKLRPHQQRFGGNLAVYSSDTIDNGKRDGDAPQQRDARSHEALDLRREEDRLETYAAWPVAFVDKARLARTGLYYYGDSDKVRCHFCKVELGNWEEGDDPAVDHERWSPLCPLLRGHAYSNVPVAGSSSQTSEGAPGRDECGSRNNVMNGPQRPQYALESARLQSFADWPSRMKQTPEAMADAGFVYTGSGDKTVCYYCGGGLKDWEDDDDPWVEHARLFPSCHYIRIVKGEEFVAKVHSRRQEPPAEKPHPPASSSIAGLSAVPAADGTSSKEAPKSETELCKLCFSGERNICFVPCGHVVACPKCALSLTTCPVCRQQFTSTMRLYYS